MPALLLNLDKEFFFYLICDVTYYNMSCYNFSTLKCLKTTRSVIYFLSCVLTFFKMLKTMFKARDTVTVHFIRLCVSETSRRVRWELESE